MSTTDPDQVRADIERTRRELSDDVDTLGEHVRPSNVAQRQTDRAKEGIGRLRDRVMGSAKSSSHQAGDSVKNAAGNVSDKVSGAPQAVKEQTQGNPLAVGVVAFGLGLLAASLVPGTRQEAEAATRVKEAAEPFVEGAKEAGSSVADNLRGSAQEHAQGLKESATEAGRDVAGHGKESAQDVAGEARGGSSGT